MKWRYIFAVFGQNQRQYWSENTLPNVNNSCLWPIEWLRFWIQLMFHLGNLLAVSKTQPKRLQKKAENQNRQKYIGLQHFASKIAKLERSCLWIALARTTCEKQHSAEDVDSRRKRSLTINQGQLCYLQKGQNRNDSASDGRSTRIVVRCFNSLCKCCSWLPWPFHWEIRANERKSMSYMFTSLTLRAVSPEVAPKLDTESCLNLLKQLIAGRGKSITITIFSDNGPIFVAAEQEFAGYVAAWNKEEMEEHIFHWGIRWKLKPTAKLHLRGEWELLVRSCKKAFYVVLGNKSVREDVFQQLSVMLSKKSMRDRLIQSIQILMARRIDSQSILDCNTTFI